MTTGILLFIVLVSFVLLFSSTLVQSVKSFMAALRKCAACSKVTPVISEAEFQVGEKVLALRTDMNANVEETV